MMPRVLWVVSRLIRYSHQIMMLSLAAVLTASFLDVGVVVLPLILIGVVATSLRLGYDLGRLGMPI
jgi:hypothetical protein